MSGRRGPLSPEALAFEQARARGAESRRAGKPRDRNLPRWSNRAGEVLHDAWCQGWDEEDARRKAKP